MAQVSDDCLLLYAIVKLGNYQNVAAQEFGMTIFLPRQILHVKCGVNFRRVMHYFLAC